MKSRPWIWIVLAFTLFLIAWAALFIIAHHAKPTYVPLEHHPFNPSTASPKTLFESAPQP